jgi:hypothetical protein
MGRKNYKFIYEMNTIQNVGDIQKILAQVKLQWPDIIC